MPAIVPKPDSLAQLVRTIRGERVMLDADLATLYRVATKALNQAVKRNLERFPADFMFQLAPEEWEALRSQIVTSYLEPLIGKSNRVYEVLNRKRPLTLAMIRRLHKTLGIPAKVLIAETVAG